ncbi:hypothetical protein OQI_33840 [Streptomyces pharetrae CZA14]|uniref:Uncharacterized protein n=1 Tax=Streptomyces pharetrae CZA14 TaxID=1144883 RepID=A0ABX3Y8V3_9ACTN|nr:hypothetical protein OQI_33840 [Streptomyces pharetrae CZA14]
MTTAQQTGTVRSEKSTQGSSQLSVGDATRTLALPQLPYADAVLAELDAVGMPPAALETGLRATRPGLPELFMRLVWPTGSHLLDDGVRDKGLTLAWSHVTGWTAHNGVGDSELLDVDLFADPALVAMAARDLAEQDLSLMWSPPDGTAGRWPEADHLDLALTRFEEKGGPTW